MQGQDASKKLKFGGGGFVVGDLLLLVESTSRGVSLVVRKRIQPGTDRRVCEQPGCEVSALAANVETN